MLRKFIISSFIFFVFFLCLMHKKNVQAVNFQVVENGIYEIETKIDSDKVIDISEASKTSTANVQIWERCNVFQQRFQITYTNDGYYNIKSVNSGKLVDVQSASKEPGTNVWQYDENFTDAQKWTIVKTEDGYYKFVSKCNNLVLTVEKSKNINGSNIEVNNNLELENQKFMLKRVEEVRGKKEISEGIYTISTALNKNKVLDISEASKMSTANVQIWEDVNVPQQKFEIKYSNGYYTMKNLNSGKMIDVSNGDIRKNTNVWQYEENYTDAQKWVITKTEDGYYNIISKRSGIYLEVEDGKISNGTNIQMNLKNEKYNQKFLFTKIEDDFGEIQNGTYEISTKLASNMILDVSEGSMLNGANVQIWADANEKQQKFEITYVGLQMYKIICKKSGKALTVEKNGTIYSSNVYQDTYNGANNQLWKIVSCGNDYYYIISVYNEKYLDVESASTSNGTNIWVYSVNYTNAQKFKLEQRSYGIDVSHWQGTIDFKTLNNSNKIDFMIIREGQGTTIVDRQFERNYSEAKKYNIPLGVYLYAKAQNVEDARNEANFLVQQLKGKSFELPIFYDIEEHENLSNETILQLYMEFYNILKKAGYKPGLYASKYYLMYKIDTAKIPQDSGIWVASYGKDEGAIPSDLYKYYGNFDIWQYTSTGKVAGITGNVDCNVIYKKK